MRNLWKGAISFGLVHVPVKLYSATERKDIKFNYLHEKCKTPIRYEKICPTCQTEVSADEIVRGYEYEKGRYVILRDEDFENIPLPTAKTVEIINFAELSEIDPVYFDKSYYLSPGDGGQKAYELLKKSMVEAGKVAIAKVIIRSKESLAALRVFRDIIIMETMFYPDEIRDAKLLPEINYNVQVSENEAQMASNLIGALTEPFNPEKYHNEYRTVLSELIESRISGAEVEIPAREETGKVVDLMEALKASIDLAKEEKERAEMKKRPKSASKKAHESR
ncbi:Ku protein [Phosphitispora sp. TUW77]|uniref:non-homologous end joining protein Ku n=1 Tax=Phosphitispora sp. TUW77 TaxID=3152361 RepID=UPI003AB6320D